MARTVLVAALVSYSIVIALNVLTVSLPPYGTAVAITGLVLVLVLQLGHSMPGANRAPLRRRVLTLSAQALFSYLPLVVFRAEWGSMAGFLAGSLLLLLPPRVGWSLYAAVGASLLVPTLLEGYSVLDTVYLCQSTLLTGLVTFGLTRLNELVAEVHATRGELAHAAVTEERLRFARDLHDLLGFGLSTITLKSELVHRLIDSNPRRAMAEVEDVLTVSRRALGDVRRVARGFRDMSLEQEISSARSVLAAANIELEARVSAERCSPEADSVLAAVLREAVTNLLRHSQAGHCTIEAGRHGAIARLLVVNDGVRPGYRDPAPDGGSGLSNLEDRVSSIGGRLETGSGGQSTFRLLAEVPAQAGGSWRPLGGEEATVGSSAA
ncbi:sensor histidine kinase [Streptomyces cyslabdanicus]|uniref:sensor histidine kinase n=1 Tax=Streptomyces cyslabdanicus TaxID=1470456 RepID=UPI004044EA57